MVLLRKIALQVDELGTGNVALFEIGPARYDLIGDFRVGNEMRRAVENPEMGIIELPRQLLGFDQKLGMGKALAGGHADFPLSIGVSIRVTRPRAQLAPDESSSAARPWRWRRATQRSAGRGRRVRAPRGAAGDRCRSRSPSLRA